MNNSFLTFLAEKKTSLLNQIKNFKPAWNHLWLLGKFFLLAFLLIVLCIGGLFLAVYSGVFGSLPTVKELGDIQNHVASEVYSADSVLLGKYYIENRTNISYSDISPYIIQALLATEDARFYEHSGVDTRSLLRVGIKSILLMNESSGGGSTISQQLAKNIFPRKRYAILSMAVNKFREMIVAQRLEKAYSKEEILTLYLNTVPFGEKAYGIAVASERFFHVPPAQLKVEQAAVLVGMLKATTAYNPRLHPEKSTQRRNVVLSQMVRYHHLSKNVADSLKQLELVLDYHYATHNTGLAPYFREYLRHKLESMLEGTPYNIYTDGLKIYTTIDSRLQNYAEKAVKQEMARLQQIFFNHWKGKDPWGKDEEVLKLAMRRTERYQQLKKKGWSEDDILENFQTAIPMQLFSWEGEKSEEMSPWDSLRYYSKFLHTGFMAMEPHTGYIRAWVGGINHKYFKYDHIKSRRQVGSTFKPIVYAAALKSGKDPCQYISNEREIYETHDHWSPGNADGNYEGEYSMKGGLTKSVNTITVKLMMDTGVKKVSKLARAMGIEHELPPDPSIALGTADLSLYEMLNVYATFAYRGRRKRPVYISAITDRRGHVIKKGNVKQSYTQVLGKETADMMIQMMQSVVDSGTAASVKYKYGLKGAIIGKTGTTQSHADGWFIGGTPRLVAGAWVGAEDRRVRFRSLSLGQGGRTALPIWANFMQQVFKDPTYNKIRKARFPTPSRRTQYRLDCPNYRLEPEDRFWDFIRFSKKQREENRRLQDQFEGDESGRENRQNRPSNSGRKKESVFEKFKRKKAEKDKRRRNRYRPY